MHTEMNNLLTDGASPRAVGLRCGRAVLRGFSAIRASLVVLTLIAGCARTQSNLRPDYRAELEQRAMQCLKAAVRYEQNPAVRVGAVEALETRDPEVAAPWVRSALLDEHPAVRFAACVAVGNMQDRVAEALISKCLDDEDPSVRVAALYARHRLGHTEHTGKLATYLLDHKDATVRRNAALVLGLLGEPGATRVLARSVRDRDPGVRHHALEAMARLGNREACQELTFMSNAGVGSDEVFAVNALAATRDRRFIETFRYKLATAPHLETRLAAGRALGLCGYDEGFEIALRALRIDRPRDNSVDDPPAGQVLRARQLSAAALGAIGRIEALKPLAKRMEETPDPRVQVSAAKAILDILARNRTRGASIARAAEGRRR